MKDYYKILDIPEYSDFSEIKTAYRKLARKWHPDIAGNTEDVIKMFKEINEAYDVLSDENRKTDYDKARRFYNYSSENFTRTRQENVNNATNPDSARNKENSYAKQENKSSSFSWEDFLKKNFGDLSTKKQERTSKRGKDINADVEITLMEAINGTTKIINMLQTQVCQKCGGRKFVNGSICPHCNGKGSTTSYKKFTVKVPAGVKDGSKIRLAGEGDKGLNGGKNGDMYLTVHVKSPLGYTINGINIHKPLILTPYEAALGANVTVQTLNGNVTVKISPNTQSGQKIRLSGCGVKKNGNCGDMILTVEIQIPKNLTEQEIELYKKLRDVSDSVVR